MMYEGAKQDQHLPEKSMLLVIVALIPVQLLASWAQAQMFLTPYLYLFSIYQHLQYVASIVVGVYVLALFSLWNCRPWGLLLLALAPLVGIYSAASGSMLTGGLALAGSAIFAVYHVIVCKYGGRRIPAWAVGSLVLGGGFAYNIWSSWTTQFVGVGGHVGSGSGGMYTQKLSGHTLLNVQSRYDIWRYYLRGVFNDPSAFLFGHSVPPDRESWPSAHNYYLDFIYNFGLIAMLAVAGLLVYTVVTLFWNRRRIMRAPSMLGLTFVVLFFLLVDNLMKVGMRQPYPGIVVFFLWGLLLARIGYLRRGDYETRSGPGNLNKPLGGESATVDALTGR